MPLPQLLLSLFSPLALLRIWAWFSALGLILVADLLLTMAISRVLGGFAAVGIGGILGFTLALLITLKTKRIYRIMKSQVSLGRLNNSIIHGYMGNLVLIGLMAIPGFFSTALALFLAISPLPTLLGRVILGTKDEVLSQIHEHLSG